MREADSYSWDLPFQLVMNKLRGSSGPLTANFSTCRDVCVPEDRLGWGEDCEEVSACEIWILLDAAVKKRTAWQGC